MAKGSLVEAFMRATGKFRAVLGPASRSSLEHEMTEQNKALLLQRQAETQQCETCAGPTAAPMWCPKIRTTSRCVKGRRDRRTAALLPVPGVK